MNPAILNYMQSRQGGAPQSSEPQGSIAQMNTSADTGSPFESGVRRAIESARESLGMTDKQQNKALRRSILSFASNIANTPKQKGFFNNFGAVSRAMIPAISEHDMAEDAYEAQNNAMYQQLQARADKERAMADSMEEKAWKQNMSEKQLAELKRYHDMKANPTINNGMSASAELGDGNYIPIQSKSERLAYAKDKKASGEILHELSSIKNDYDKFKELSQDDLINPMTPYGVGATANSVKDIFGYFSGKKELREETTKRKALEAKLGKFAIELERKIKGGVLSEGMVKRFENKGLLPSLSDNPEIFEEKLGNLTKEMSDRYKASDASLRYNVHLSPYDLEMMEQQAQSLEGDSVNSGENQGSTDTVLMQDISGNQYMIPVAESEEAINDGLTPVEAQEGG